MNITKKNMTGDLNEGLFSHVNKKSRSSRFAQSFPQGCNMAAAAPLQPHPR